MEGEVVKFPPSGYRLRPSKGSAGLATQAAGAMASVSNLASVSGGIGSGKLAERDTK